MTHEKLVNEIIEFSLFKRECVSGNHIRNSKYRDDSVL